MTEQRTWQTRFSELQETVSRNLHVSAEEAAGDWTDRVRDALIAWEISRDDYQGDEAGLFLDVAQDAFELMVSGAGLSRMKPELVHELWEELQETISEDSDALVRLVLELDPLADWLSEATTWLDESIEPRWQRSTLAERSIDMFRRLDDAELAAWAVERFAPQMDLLEFEDPIEKCVRWACEHPELFLEAERYVYAQFAAFKSDLEDSDPTLALTQIKFHRVIEEIEAQRRFLAGDLGSAGRHGSLLSQLAEVRDPLPQADVIHVSFGFIGESNERLQFAADSADSVPSIDSATAGSVDEWAGQGTLSVLVFDGLVSVVLEGATERPVVEVVALSGEGRRLEWREAEAEAPDRTEAVERTTIQEIRISGAGLRPLRLKLD